MKVVVIGGTGLIGSKLIARLVSNGHDAVAAALQTGVNTMTGQGLDDAVAGADVVVDVSNSPSFADDDVMSFFVTSTGNILEADRRAGVRHHVALSVVGTGSLPDSGYLRAKAAQEELIERPKTTSFTRGPVAAGAAGGRPQGPCPRGYGANLCLECLFPDWAWLPPAGHSTR